MLDDIAPPSRPNKNPSRRHPQRSLRLRGHSLDGARSRLVGGDTVSKDNEKTLQEAFVGDTEKPLKPKRQRFGWWKKLSKNKRFAIVSFLLLIFSAGAIGYFYFIQPTSAPAIEITRSAKPPPPKTVASPLTGVDVEPALASRPVTGIMIENSKDARPQSGVEQAGVIFEAIAEGGITRFLTLYQEAQPQYVGPVRSLRPYYLDFLVPFDASIAHAGGSPEALAQVRAGMKDLDQFFNAGSYWRVSSRVAPHNLFTSFEKLDALNKSKGYTSSNVASWPRKTEKKLEVPTAKTIDLAISSANYNVHYDYDAATNTYPRSISGAPHNATASEGDKTGVQLRPKVVVVLVTTYSISGNHSVYGTSGSGQVFVFQDGGVTVGLWSKAGRSSQLVFIDSAEAPVKLNPGQTWVTLLANASKLTYAP